MSAELDQVANEQEENDDFAIFDISGLALGFCYSMNSFNLGHTVLLISSESRTFFL